MCTACSVCPPRLVAGNDRACCWRGGVLDSVHRKVLRGCGGREKANATGAGLGKVSAAGAVGPEVYSAPEYARVHRVSNDEYIAAV